MNGLLEVSIDGELRADGWPHDRSLQYGDGLFETMLVRQGRIRFEALHRARLAAGCARLAIHADALRIWASARAGAQRHPEALLKLQLSRGDAVARGYTAQGTEQARVIVSVFAPPSAAEIPARLRAVTLQARLGENPDLAGIKHCNRLEQVLARRGLQGSGAFEGLMASSSGLLVSGTMSNVFLELDGELVTPALQRCGVAGVMRAAALREAARAGMPVRVMDLPLQVLERCTALSLSNARLGLLPVHELDQRELVPSARLLAIAAALEPLDE
jgi:4-amino-4-deoxychorismate lyase